MTAASLNTTAPLGATLASPGTLAAAFAEGAETAVARKQRLVVAAAFTLRFGDTASWRLAWGHYATQVHPQFSASFAATAHRIGFTTKEVQRQWEPLPRSQRSPGSNPAACTGTDSTPRATNCPPRSPASTPAGHPITLTTPLHGLEATLAALDVLEEPRAKAGTTNSRQAHWDRIAIPAPVLATTMRRYLAQLGLSLRPGSVALIDTSLHHLADYLTEHHGDVSSAADIGRSHIEGFKAWLAARSGYRGHRAPAKTTIGMRISHLWGFSSGSRVLLP